jgi:LPXTG-motif cell wall-anchored protein
MRIALNIVGVLLVVIGGIWFLQGINVLPGSFMTGQIRWAVYGGIAVIVGIALLLAAKRRRNGPA